MYEATKEEKAVSPLQLKRKFKKIVAERIIELALEIASIKNLMYPNKNSMEMFLFNWDFYVKFLGNPYHITDLPDAATKAAIQNGR